jgi:ATP-dependent Clp protease ATP-binding subunit ClpA
MLTQENLDKNHTDEEKITFIVFDEVEKASGALWQLLLGILDKATLTLGDNRRVDFSRCVIVMTSNLASKEIEDLLGGGIGFAPVPQNDKPHEHVDLKIYRTAIEALKRRFTPEFVNRIDKTIVFRALKKSALYAILEIELIKVQNRITESAGTKFTFDCSDESKEFLIQEGWSPVYGGRHLKRAIERFLVHPLSNLVATEQVELGDFVSVDYNEEKEKLEFRKQTGAMIIAGPDPADEVKVMTVGQSPDTANTTFEHPALKIGRMAYEHDLQNQTDQNLSS